MDIILVICKSAEFHDEKFLADISRVLKPGGSVLLYLSSQSPSLQVVLSSLLAITFIGGLMILMIFPGTLQDKISLERKLLLSGFLDVQISEAGQSVGVCHYFHLFYRNEYLISSILCIRWIIA